METGTKEPVQVYFPESASLEIELSLHEKTIKNHDPLKSENEICEETDVKFKLDENQLELKNNHTNEMCLKVESLPLNDNVISNVSPDLKEQRIDFAENPVVKDEIIDETYEQFASHECFFKVEACPFEETDPKVEFDECDSVSNENSINSAYVSELDDLGSPNWNFRNSVNEVGTFQTHSVAILPDSTNSETSSFQNSNLKPVIQNRFRKLSSPEHGSDSISSRGCKTPADKTGTTPDDRTTASNAASPSLPQQSRRLYEKTYVDFQDWKKSSKIPEFSFSENDLLAYFSEMSESKKSPSTLSCKYSMLKLTINLNHNIDISSYAKLTAFLKRKNIEYVPKKAKVFDADDIRRFLSDAPDELFLVHKVVTVFGICGALRLREMMDIEISDIEERGSSLLVKVRKTKTNKHRSFTIDEEYTLIVNKYRALRPPNCKTTRFFVNFQKAKCTQQWIGINKLRSIPETIAEFLYLPDPKSYTGHSFRHTSTTFLANAGADITTIRHHGDWRIDNAVPEEYVEDSLRYKKKTGCMIKSVINGTDVSASSSKSSRVLKIVRDEPNDRDFTAVMPTEQNRCANADSCTCVVADARNKKKIPQPKPLSSIQDSDLRSNLDASLGEPFTCHLCKEDFFQTEDFISHMQTHKTAAIPRKRFACGICHRRFLKEMGLKRHHKVVHQNDPTLKKPFACDLCTSEFTQKIHLILHKQEHEISPLICGEQSSEKCNVPFQTMMNPFGKKRYKKFTCDVCARRFETKVEIASHMQMHVTDDSNTNSWYTCELCPNQYTLESSLRLHYTLVHENNPNDQYTCSVRAK